MPDEAAHLSVFLRRERIIYLQWFGKIYFLQNILSSTLLALDHSQDTRLLNCNCNIFKKNMNAPEFPRILHEIKCRVENLICDYIAEIAMDGTDSPKNLSIPHEFIEQVNSINSDEKNLYNYCLCNHYRSGDEYMGYHADDEGCLDPHTPIASVSFGITRNFDVRARKKRSDAGRPRLARLALGDGDLLLMFPPMQDYYEHSIPVEKRVAGERINLTFRRIII
jgi:hypothetical protein